jgi:carboxymethylenebutenolidase
MYHRLRRLAAAGLIVCLQNAYAEETARDDARLETGYVELGGIRAYVARPKNALGKMPAVLVIHGGRGLTAHIEDVSRRLALHGYYSVAPELAGQLDRQQATANLVAMVDDLSARPEIGRIACLGFRWGGGMANQLAVNSAKLAAAAAFYGPVADAVDVPRIRARLLLHYAERDPRINTGVPAYEAALKAAGVQYALHVYMGTEHAFHDASADRHYNKEAAELAWQRTLAFFKDLLP